MKKQFQICVVGNGAVGKASALALAQAGYSVMLLSPSQAESNASKWKASGEWDCRVYALNHATKNLLSSLKVWDAMDQARIAPIEAMDIKGDDTQHAGHLSFDAYGAHVGALAWIVEDGNLNLALDNALQFTQGVEIMQATATQMHVDAEEVQIDLNNGSAIHTSLVLGADGANSWIRAQTDIGLDYRSYDQRAVVANFSCDKPHHGVASQWFLGAEGIVALLPLAGSQVSLVWSAPDKLAETLLSETAEQLASRLNKLPQLALGELHPLPPAVPRGFPLRLMRAQSFAAERTVLVGDAAHVFHPLAGQGMNLGFADVIALLEALGPADANTDCGEARALQRYARSRKEEVLLMQLATDGLERLFTSDFTPLRVLRNTGMNIVNRVPFLKRSLIKRALGKSPSIFS
jgi:ubiquinone biosynthesis UbiH/UbiF/VisC/COQ6 family hydroxylase